jgi:hypothetical protein
MQEEKRFFLSAAKSGGIPPYDVCAFMHRFA